MIRLLKIIFVSGIVLLILFDLLLALWAWKETKVEVTQTPRKGVQQPIIQKLENDKTWFHDSAIQLWWRRLWRNKVDVPGTKFQESPSEAFAKLMNLKEGPDQLYLIRNLLKEGVDPNTMLRNENGESYSALHLAAISGRSELALLLLQNGATVDSKGLVNIDGTKIDGVTPLMLAIFHGNTECVKVLLQMGSRTDLKASNNIGPLGFMLLCKDRQKSMEMSDILSNQRNTANRPKE